MTSTRERVDALERRMDDFEGLVSNHTREVTILATNVRRLADAVERRIGPERSPLPERIDVPPYPRLPTSWHQQIREKQVSVPKAAAWSTVALALVELVHAIADGRLRLW